MNNSKSLLCLAVLAIFVVLALAFTGKCSNTPAMNIQYEGLRGGGGGRGGGFRGGGGRGGGGRGGRGGFRGFGGRGGRGGWGGGRRPYRYGRRHGGYFPYWGYSYGYPQYYWWNDPLYYYDIPYYIDYDDPCDEQALASYKKCIDDGVAKEKCADILEAALEKC